MAHDPGFWARGCCRANRRISMVRELAGPRALVPVVRSFGGLAALSADRRSRRAASGLAHIAGGCRTGWRPSLSRDRAQRRRRRRYLDRAIRRFRSPWGPAPALRHLAVRQSDGTPADRQIEDPSVQCPDRLPARAPNDDFEKPCDRRRRSSIVALECGESSVAAGWPLPAIRRPFRSTTPGPAIAPYTTHLTTSSLIHPRRA